MKIENEFIPYEQALALKELGLDKPCIMCYYGISNKDEDKKERLYLPSGMGKVCNSHLVEKEDGITAPLYQQAFRWFREKYDLVIEPCVPFQRLYSTEEDHFEILEFGYRIYSFDQYRGGLRDKIEWDGYDNSNEEEAELECLKKLIEIVKNK